MRGLLTMPASLKRSVISLAAVICCLPVLTFIASGDEFETTAKDFNPAVAADEMEQSQSHPSVARGKAYYTTCAACHGINGEGNPYMHGPRLTLQGSDYLHRQLRNYQQMVRGGLADFYGWQMNGRANALPDDQAIRDVTAYIDLLPDTYARDTLGGDISRGKPLYDNHCASCHGGKAEGIPDLNAPALAGLEGWYQLEQLRKFKDGTRGSHESDIPGQQMKAAMAPIGDEQAMIDIIDYINEALVKPEM